MDIKNILNEGDRRAIQQQSQPRRAYHSERYPQTAPSSQLHPASAMVRNPTSSYAYQPRAHQQQMPQPHQIVYTGPVYQLPAALPPAVEVRHIGNAIQYRYASYPYEEPPPVDYVYQEYSEIPRQPAQSYQYRYDPPEECARQPASRQQYRSRPYYSTRDPYSPRDYYSEHDVARNRYSSRDPYDNCDPYSYCDSYTMRTVRDSLVSRVVPVEGGYQYRPAPERPRQPADDIRYSPEEYHRARYPSPPPRTQADYDTYPYERYRSAQHTYKRARPTSPPPRSGSARRETYANNPPRSYQPARTYLRKRRDYATSQDSSEAAENARYTVLKPEFEGEGPRRKRLPNTVAPNTGDDVSPQSNIVKAEPRESGKAELVKTGSNGKRARAKNTEIDSVLETASRRSHDAAADLADDLSAVTARRPHHSRPSPDGWSSDDNMTLNHFYPRRSDAKRSNQSAGARAKKRRLPPVSPEHVKRIADDRRTSSAADRMPSRSKDDSPRERSAFKQVRKGEDVRMTSTDDGSLEEEILDGAGSCGEKIALDSTSSCESDMGENADIESVGSVREHVPVAEKAKTHRAKVHPRQRPKKKFVPPCLDPKESYPPSSKEFLGVPPGAVGDLLQVWDFVSSFAKTLRLTSFKLHHLQQAIVHTDRCALLDACILRLVQAIISDEALVKELRIPSAVTKGLSTKPGKNAVGVILQNLPNILDFESDEQDDHLLQETVSKLDSSTNKQAFYKILDPAGKLRILRELVDYATMADHLRSCVTDSMDHAEEEKKKAREENAANRKKLEIQVRELRAELLDYRVKNRLLENSSNGDSDRGGLNSVKENGIKSESVSVASDREESLSRKEKVLAAKKERREQEEKREKERGAEAIVARIDKVKANLKTLKNVRLRNRAKDGDDRMTGSGCSVSLGELYEDPVRTYPLGSDRQKLCYWFFSGSGRVWVENTSNGEWCCFPDMDGIHGLMKWLSPYRKEEQSLKRNIWQRLEIIENEMLQEKRSIEQAEQEEKNAAETAPRTTRAGKRKATQVKVQKKAVVTFLDYRNQER